MKKASVVLGVALLALLIFSCDSLVVPVDTAAEETQYTEDGRALVNVTIGAAATNRALTAALAEAAVDFYEVAFYDGMTTYRTTWEFGGSGQIAVPAGTYDSAEKAILFAGRSQDKTLLAVGTLTTPAGGVIDSDTTGITFTLYPLTNDITADAADNTFRIMSGTSVTPTVTSGYIPLASFLDSSNQVIQVPRFDIPSGVADITADYSIALGNSGNITTAGLGIIIQNPIAVSTGAQSTSAGVKPVKVTATVTPAAGGNLSGGKFTLTINTTGVSAGLSKLAMNVAVCAIDTSEANPVTWYIRGGLNNGYVDGGASSNSLGGSVILQVGTVAGVNPTYPITTP